MPSNFISSITAHEILDSRGNPTVEVTVVTEGGATGTSAVPSGASTGVHEAHELRDGDPNQHHGKGVLKAVANVNGEIAQHLKGMSVTDQRGIDDAMCKLDGTPNKDRLGANAILGVSLAVARAGAASQNLPLYKYIRQAFSIPDIAYTMPMPMMNIINGGRHANTHLQVQEFMIVPQIKNNGVVDIAKCVQVGEIIFKTLGEVLAQQGQSTTLGDEGGYAADMSSAHEALTVLTTAIAEAGYTAGEEAAIALDVAASEFFDNNAYQFEGQSLSAGDMINKYIDWHKNFSIISIEDGLAEDDWAGWKQLTVEMGDKVMLIGDDLFVTNRERLQKGIDSGVANAILIKVNQIGTLSETIDTVMLAQENGYNTIVSHRSGETMDTFIADLAVATSSPYLKAGAPSKPERRAKYQRLIEIAQDLAK